MKKIYVSYDHTGQPTALILAENKREADIAFMSMKTGAHKVEEIDLTNESYSPVYFILTSDERNTSEYARGAMFRAWKRGL